MVFFLNSFAAKTSDLHDFSPDKEPLSSMLDGEIQPMFMCKPGNIISVHYENVFKKEDID